MISKNKVSEIRLVENQSNWTGSKPKKVMKQPTNLKILKELNDLTN